MPAAKNTAKTPKADLSTEANAKVEAPKEEVVKVSIKSSPPITKTVEPVEDKSLATHHELKIQAPESIDIPEADPKPEAETTVNAPAPEVAKTDIKEPAKPEVVDPKPPIDDVPKQPVGTKPTGLSGATQTDDMQSPKVFDTKQYHLPIQESHSSAGKHMMIFVVVFLLVVLVGGLLAIDGGWLDPGFSLPFDLIK